MDYSNQPIGRFLSGPLLHTQQGLVVVVFSIAYFLLAGVIAYVSFEPAKNWQTGKIVAICLAWPLILFLLLVKNNQPAFSPSWSKALWLIFYGLLPIGYFLYDLQRT